MKTSFAASMFKRLAKRAGVKVNIEPKYGFAKQVVSPNGAKRYFLASSSDLNTLGASEIAKDKDYAAYFLRLMGYPVLQGEAFFTSEWAKVLKTRRDPSVAYRYAKRLGFPLIVKPNSLSQGNLVCKVHNREEFFQAIGSIARKDRVFLVQRFAHGRDYRIVVLDGKVISAYERLPLSVTGDGRSTIGGLLKKKQREFRRAGRDTVIKPDDFRITNRLRHLGLSRQSILVRGEVIELLDNKNLSSGGDAVDVSEQIHPSYRLLCIKLAKDMNLRFCGVDLMVEDAIDYPAHNYRIIEINSAPGIDNYASIGHKQRQVVEQMYLEILKALARK